MDFRGLGNFQWNRGEFSQVPRHCQTHAKLNEFFIRLYEDIDATCCRIGRTQNCLQKMSVVKEDVEMDE